MTVVGVVLLGVFGVALLAQVWGWAHVRQEQWPYAERDDVVDMARTVCPTIAEDLEPGSTDPW